MVTLKDVAQAAGVSTSTASRVLDERLPRSKTAAAQRVREAAAELGYVRDPFAAALRRTGTSTIGIVVPRLTDTVMALMYEELSAAAAARGLFAVVASTHDDPARERVAVETLLRRKVDGIIRTTARTDAPLEPFAQAPHVRQVLALRGDGQSSEAVGDDVLGGRLATRHLLDLGHRDIALVNGPSYATSAAGRRDGFMASLAEAKIEPDPFLVVEGDYSTEAGEQAALQLLTRTPRPTAIFAANDKLAIGIVSIAARLGLRIPEDLSLVGYNDIPVVSKLPTPLTTVRVPFQQIAAGALKLLLDDSSEERQSLVYAPTLIPRHSTAPLGR
ncbi:LacI family transcriptional regulator [Luteococcus japonicus]|uniref:LacI family transcriptional regulator n=1 Tax=Luteococcus japonicus TaxID=33984 RepID=A0A3N1ZW80_9ACTN|nr:LacI family DNA-binding transcriptional regulator [Luteococcus japonicus]ROR55056.1 LacI family transcriptional regulator [Luteococcus japonicus]